MYKLILKTADKTLETRLLPDHAAAVEAWQEMRAKDYGDSPVALLACWGNRIFLRHYFHHGPESMDYVSPDATIAQYFYQGAGGESIVMRPPGRPPKDKTRDWAAVDWTKTDAALAQELDVARQTVAAQRKRHGPK